jgi:CheY-like chemotaxis protein
MTKSLKETNFKEQLSTIRHDMRTPVGHIIGYSEMLEEDLDDETAKLYSGDLQAIQNAGHRLLALIDDYIGSSVESIDQINFTDAQFHMRLQLNHILGYTEMLHEEAIDEGKNQLLDDLNQIVIASKEVLNKVDNLGSQAFHAASVLQNASTIEKKEASIKISLAKDEATKENLVGYGGEILVVDDDPANRKLLVRRLTRSGYRATPVENGEEALDQLAQQRYDLILLDYMMPGLSGLETLERIKASPTLRTIPVIMLSASDNVENISQCILQGADDYVVKPFNPILLRARISACLEKTRLRQSVARQLKVFISSPGDVIPERQIVKNLIGRLNEEFMGQAYLIPILWEEEPMLASETFQAQIHSPKDTEIYIGILWSRIGSPLPDTILREDGTRYESGTAFEFEDAMQGFKINGKPKILLYKKEGAPTVSLENKEEVLNQLDQIEKLNNYINQWLIDKDGSYKGAYHTFKESEQLDTMIETHLRSLVQKILGQEISHDSKIKTGSIINA